MVAGEAKSAGMARPGTLTSAPLYTDICLLAYVQRVMHKIAENG